MRCFLLLLVIFSFSSELWAREYKGEIIKITDGDTVVMRAGNNRRMKIRLAEIDAPEKRQPYGKESMQALTQLAAGQKVIVIEASKDRYKRTVGTVMRPIDNLNVNREMVVSGNAWAYREYIEDNSILALEDHARAFRLGLWGLPDDEIMPPWKWRKSWK